MFKLDRSPIIVIVANGRYESFGPATSRSRYLSAFLQKLGGINESVPDGTYHFNVVFKGFKLVTTLEPVKD